MTIDNQPRSAIQQTTHSTRQNDHLTDATLSIISIYDDICDATNDLVGDGASVVDQFNGGERGPSLLYDLKQKQSFESLDDIRGFHDNDTITSMASHLSATSIASSVSEGDGFHRGVLRLCCMILKSNAVITVRSLWLIVISHMASQSQLGLDSKVASNKTSKERAI
jgi:hypothetical protein